MWANAGLGAFVAIAYFLSRKLYQDVFTPLFMYVLVWGTDLILFRLRFVNYDRLESRTIAIIAGSLVAFVLGCLGELSGAFFLCTKNGENVRDLCIFHRPDSNPAKL